MSYGSQQQQQQQHEHEDVLSSPGGEFDATWGEAPQRIAAIGLQEDEAAFGTRLRYVGTRRMCLRSCAGGWMLAANLA